MQIQGGVRGCRETLVWKITSSRSNIGASLFDNLFLRRALGQQVSILEVVDFDVLDVVAVGNIHLAIESGRRVRVVGRCLGPGRGRSQGGLDGRDVDMLNTLSSLELGVDPGRGRRCSSSSIRRRLVRLGSAISRQWAAISAFGAPRGRGTRSPVES
jgi:hypothetical protein